MSGSSDENLILGLLNQDKALIEELYARMRKPAARLVVQLGGQAADANDALQEAVIALYVNLKKNQYQQYAHVKLSTYLLQVVKFQWLNNRNKAYFQREESLQAHHEGQNDVDIQKDLENLERNQQIRKILNLLPDRCQQIFKLFYWEKRNMQEIAKSLNISADSAKNAKYRCMQKAKTIYKDSNFKIDL